MASTTNSPQVLIQSTKPAFQLGTPNIELSEYDVDGNLVTVGRLGKRNPSRCLESKQKKRLGD
jgi:hypothetical protein